MRRNHRTLWIIAAALLTALLFTGCGLSLAGDVTPPPNYRPPAQPTAAYTAVRFSGPA